MIEVRINRRMIAWCISSVKHPVIDFSFDLTTGSWRWWSLAIHWECFTSGIPKFIKMEPKIKEHSIALGDKQVSFGKGKQTVREVLHMHACVSLWHYSCSHRVMARLAAIDGVGGDTGVKPQYRYCPPLGLCRSPWQTCHRGCLLPPAVVHVTSHTL